MLTRRTRSLLVIAGVYLILLMFFAGVYDLYWTRNTSKFIVNREFNEYTVDIFSLFENKLRFDTSALAVPFSIEKMNEVLSPFYQQIVRFQANLDSCEADIRRHKLQQDSLTFVENRSFDSTFHKYMGDQLAPLTRIQDSLQRIIGTIETSGRLSLGDNTENRNQVKFAQLNYELSRTNLAIAESTYYIYSRGLGQRELFIDPDLFNQGANVISELRRSYHKESVLTDSLLEIDNTVFSLIGRFHDNRREKIGLFDFFYFSVVTATSTGFGDIVPNSTEVRAVTTVQILLSLTLFGVFLAKLTKDRGHQ